MKTTWLSCPLSNACRNYFSEGKTTPSYLPAHPCSCRARWPLISLCTSKFYQNNSSNNAQMLLLPTPRASESSPLKAASAAPPKLSGSPVLCSHLPGSFSFIRNKWIFQLWAIHQKEKQTTLYCSSNACTRSTRKRPHNVGSVNHYSEGCKTLFWDRESCARTCVHLGVLLPGLQSTIYAVLQLIMLRLETNWSWRKPPGSTQQPCSGEIVPTAQASTQNQAAR